MVEAVDARGKWSAFASPQLAALLIVAVAIATRIVAWWNPVPHVDDQFYLLAGQELLNGRWPYVDVWDRKPLGLFLLYAAIAWIGGGSMFVLNIIATAFAAATAWVIRLIGLRFASPVGATLGALAYLFVIPMVGGQTGQSPVFYNLLMAGAALLMIDAAGAGSAQGVTRRAYGAMLLCGLAMTIKQISFIEGAYFGLAFLWLIHRQAVPAGRLVTTAAIMILIALLPTGLAFAGYALAGPEARDTFLFATVTSIFLKSGWELTAKLAGIAYFFLYMTPLLIMAAVGALDRSRSGDGRVRHWLLGGWMVAALLGYVAVPHFFDHYALPVVVPLSVSAATFFDRPSGKLFFLGFAAYYLIAPPIRDVETNHQARIEFERISAEVERARRGGCIFVSGGPTRLYSTTGACKVTRYLFPDHLNLIIEVGAVGTDTGQELRAIMRRRPAVIVTQNYDPRRFSPAYRSFIVQLRRDYRRVYAAPHGAPRTVQVVYVWQRKDLASPGT